MRNGEKIVQKMKERLSAVVMYSISTIHDVRPLCPWSVHSPLNLQIPANSQPRQASQTGDACINGLLPLCGRTRPGTGRSMGDQGSHCGVHPFSTDMCRRPRSVVSLGFTCFLVVIWESGRDDRDLEEGTWERRPSRWGGSFELGMAPVQAVMSLLDIKVGSDARPSAIGFPTTRLRPALARNEPKIRRLYLASQQGEQIVHQIMVNNRCSWIVEFPESFPSSLEGAMFSRRELTWLILSVANKVRLMPDGNVLARSSLSYRSFKSAILVGGHSSFRAPAELGDVTASILFDFATHAIRHSPRTESSGYR